MTFIDRGSLEGVEKVDDPSSGEENGDRAFPLLSRVDAAHWQLVPEAPTREMINASISAMRKRRKRACWVAEKQKHAWRLAAAPHWDIAKPSSGVTFGVDKGGAPFPLPADR
ncbi:hypothetical protein [uncultured Bosea sp.]|uniref:hypothetical protein n=1 Tax=uncultured Bosea sp. TaxID=211457 RepID=UPI0025F8772B|nr:hypothetical protein [uncultured Bosea sp.]